VGVELVVAAVVVVDIIHTEEFSKSFFVTGPVINEGVF